MILNLTRQQIVDLLFALELAEDNAPGMRRWYDLRTELRLQLLENDAGSICAGKNAECEIGFWIPTEYDGYADGYPVYDAFECSKCGYEHNGEKDTLTAFCPNCGKKMEVLEHEGKET